MPKFSNLAAENGNGDGHATLEDTFKDSPSTTVVNDLLTKYRVRAAEILRVDMPAKIKHIETLLAGEDDPTSPFYKGAVDVGDYVRPRMAQPGDIRSGKVVLEGIVPGDVVLPNEITRGATSATASALARGYVEGNVGEHDADGEGEGEGEAEGEESSDFCVPVETKTGGQTFPVGAHWYEVVPENKAHSDLIQITLKEHEDLHLMVMDLRVWLEMEVPVIEDGNSFGAEVQGHLISQLDMIQKRATGMYNTAQKHYTDRLALVRLWIKYPNLQDYPNAIASSDRFDRMLVHSSLRNLLVSYGGLLTRFERNWAKVIHPKGPGGGAPEAMY